jgi:hypothetical protein
MECQVGLIKRMIVKSPMRAAVLAGAALLLPHSSAQAGLVLDFDNNALVVTDNNTPGGVAGGDNDPVTGTISTFQSIANFGITVTTAVSNSPGNSTDGLLQTTALNIKNNNPGQATLIIRISDSGFTQPGSSGTGMLLGSAIGGTFTNAGTADTVQFQSFVDPADGVPAGPVSTANLSFTNTLGGAGPNSFSGSNSAGWTYGSGPYSLTDIAIVTLSPGGIANISGSTTATAVPEPVIGAAALLGVTLLGRRRRN